MHLLHARRSTPTARSGGCPPTRPSVAAVAARSARSSAGPCARAVSSGRQHVGRRAARRDAQQRRRPAGRAPRPAGRTPARTRSRWRPPSGRSCRSSARAPARPRRSRANRPTSSAAKCCASAALPPLPHSQHLAARPASACTPGRRGRDDRRRTPRRAPGGERRSCRRRPFDGTRRGRRRHVTLTAPGGRCRRAPSRSRRDVRLELLLGHLQRRVDLRRHLDLHRVVLAQRMAFPVLGHQQPPQVAVPVEDDAEQVPHLALEPVGGRPDAASRRHVRVLAARGAPSGAAARAERRCDTQVVDDLEARLARPAVDRRHVGQDVEAAARAVAQRPADRQRACSRGHDEGRLIDGRPPARRSAPGTAALQRGDERGSVHVCVTPPSRPASTRRSSSAAGRCRR